MSNDEVKHFRVPFYEGLRVKDMLSMVRQVPDLKAYFPEERDWPLLNREWISCVSEV